MGLAGNPNQPLHSHQQQQQPPPPLAHNGLPPSDPARPPRLSRRERDYYCFYMDLSMESHHLLPSLIRYATAYGAVLFVLLGHSHC